MCSQSAGTFLIRIASETGIGYSSGYSFCRPCWLLGTWIFRLYWDARRSWANLEIHDLPRMSLSLLRIFVCLHRLLTWQAFHCVDFASQSVSYNMGTWLTRGRKVSISWVILPCCLNIWLTPSITHLWLSACMQAFNHKCVTLRSVVWLRGMMLLGLLQRSSGQCLTATHLA